MYDIDLIVAIPKRRESDPVPIGRPTGTEVVAAIGELDQSRSIDMDDIDVVIAGRSAVKRETGSIRRPGTAPTDGIQIRDLPHIRTIRVHNKQLALARARGSK